MNKHLIILGASGHGKVVLDIAKRINNWKEIYFVDDKISGEVLGHKVIGTTDVFENLNFEYNEIIVAIGDNNVRKKWMEYLEQNKYTLPILVDPSAVIGVNVKITKGTVVMANAVINVDSKIGKGCIINTSAVIEHDCEIHDFSHISPNATLGGNVKINTLAWIGLGSIILNNISVSQCSIVGAGATVINNIEVPGVYVGTPARKIR